MILLRVLAGVRFGKNKRGFFMRTHVSIIVSSEGRLLSEVARMFKELGFKPTLGMHDFVYDWEETKVTPEKVIELVDKVQIKLKGAKVGLHFVTDS
jgi:hypothetical protein